MHPLLFELENFPLKIHLYGVMYALGFILGLLWVRYESKRVGLNVEQMSDLFFYILIAGTVGSRLLYVAIETPHLFLKPWEILKIWEGGLVYYGGLIGALLIAILYCRRKKLPFWKVADVYVPGLALGHMFGRLGCFFAGCCYGRQCDPQAWYAIHFPDVKYGIAPPGIPLYPTQLMESLGNLIIFLTLVLYRRKKSFDGQVFILYVALYALMRSSIELLRGDESRGYVITNVLSTSQFISLLAVVGVIGLWIWRKRKLKSSSLP